MEDIIDIGLKKNNTIDSRMKLGLNREINHWRDVLTRILIFVQFLGTQNLAFRGSSDTLYKEDNGNFLKLLEHISKFDLVLAEHLRRFQSNETQYSYLSKNIQNEIIGIIAQTVKEKIINEVKASQYFSIIVDSTPDKSRTEQVSVIVRYVHIDSNVVKVKEHFLGFLESTDTTGLGLTQLVLRELELCELSINNCRGQGYDNGSNMKRKNLGMQAHIKSLEPRAFFVPCSAHSLNLLVNDGAKCSQYAVGFFKTVQNLYNFFATSTKRWDILKKHVSVYTLKPLCETRWESRIDSLKPLKFQLNEINEALIEIIDSCKDSDTESEATSICKNILDFKFIVSLLIWYDILDNIKICSKYLQSPKVCISTAVDILNSSRNIIEEMRCDEKFEIYLKSAEEVARELEIPPEFPTVFMVRSLRFPDRCEDTVLDPIYKFKVDFYFKILDQAIESIKERFIQLNDHSSTFSFLYNKHSLSLKSDEDITLSCSKLEQNLSSKGKSDISSLELLAELKVLSTIIRSYTSPVDTLSFIYQSGLDISLPNTVVALRIY